MLLSLGGGDSGTPDDFKRRLGSVVSATYAIALWGSAFAASLLELHTLVRMDGESTVPLTDSFGLLQQHCRPRAVIRFRAACSPWLGIPLCPNDVHLAILRR